MLKDINLVAHRISGKDQESDSNVMEPGKEPQTILGDRSSRKPTLPLLGSSGQKMPQLCLLSTVLVEGLGHTCLLSLPSTSRPCWDPCLVMMRSHACVLTTREFGKGALYGFFVCLLFRFSTKWGSSETVFSVSHNEPLS